MDNDHKITISLEEGDGYFLKTNLYEYMPKVKNQMITTDLLGMAFEPEQKYENPDGTPIVMNKDYFEKEWDKNPGAGPFSDYESLKL